ncbi:MAG: AAA family ATPase, partial [Verrucomicrobiota bacterium]
MNTHTSSTPASTLEPKEVRFACPKCDQHLAAPLEMVGHGVTCPHCADDLVVPEKSVDRPSIQPNSHSKSSSSAELEPETKERPFDEVSQKKTVNPSAAAPIDSVDNDPIKALAQLADARLQMKKEIAKIIVGNDEIVDQVLTAFFARGHCLLMGVPGLAKTLLVNTLAQTLSLGFKRIQFTPDLMPTDITGTNILEEDRVTGKRNFTFRKGPVFTNILLADEINRTPPKTQASLLEAMQEKQVTNGNQIMQLPDPFLVLATQNPLEQEGTYPLPEAQLD